MRETTHVAVSVRNYLYNQGKYLVQVVDENKDDYVDRLRHLGATLVIELPNTIIVKVKDRVCRIGEVEENTYVEIQARFNIELYTGFAYTVYHGEVIKLPKQYTEQIIDKYRGKLTADIEVLLSLVAYFVDRTKSVEGVNISLMLQMHGLLSIRVELGEHLKIYRYHIGLYPVSNEFHCLHQYGEQAEHHTEAWRTIDRTIKDFKQ